MTFMYLQMKLYLDIHLLFVIFFPKSSQHTVIANQSSHVQVWFSGSRITITSKCSSGCCRYPWKTILDKGTKPIIYNSNKTCTHVRLDLVKTNTRVCTQTGAHISSLQLSIADRYTYKQPPSQSFRVILVIVTESVFKTQSWSVNSVLKSLALLHSYTLKRFNSCHWIK